MAESGTQSRELYAANPLDHGRREIRLVDFEIGRPPYVSITPDTPVRLLMSRCSLDDDSISYRALSYTWRNPTPEYSRENPWIQDPVERLDYGDRVIYVNNRELIVTANLFFFLRRLQKKLFIDRIGQRFVEPFFLWIDAISINQEDLGERAQQVRIMPHIYKRCREVLVWLGEEEGDTDSDMATTLVETVLNEFVNFCEGSDNATPSTIVESIEKLLAKFETNIANEEDSQTLIRLISRLQTLFLEQADFFSFDVRCDRRAWTAVGRMVMRSWFHRVWTFQEKTFSNSGTIFIGGTSIPWANFHFVMSLLFWHDQMEGRRILMQNSEARWYTRSIIPSQIDMAFRLDLKFSLLDAVRCVRSRECHDPRDKIFGVLGIAHERDAGSLHFLPRVNYETYTTCSLYKDFAQFYLENQREISILQQCNASLPSMDGLPSWAPDWSKGWFETPIYYHQYYAARDSQCRVEYRDITDELHISGVLVDYCTIITPLAHPHVSFETIVTTNKNCREFLDLFANTYKVGCGLESVNNLEKGWVEFSESIDWEERYSVLETDQTYAEAYWRALFFDLNPYVTTDFVPNSPIDNRIPPDMSMRKLIDIQLALKPVPEDFEPDITDMDARRAKLCHPFNGRMLDSILGRQIYLTEKGYLGLAPHQVEQGDIIVVLFGCKVPMMLRKIDDHYIVIGDTYLHGFMDGKAMDMLDDSNTIDFNLR